MCNGEEATTQEIRKREFKHFVVQDLFLLSLLISTTGNYKIHTVTQSSYLWTKCVSLRSCLLCLNASFITLKKTERKRELREGRREKGGERRQAGMECTNTHPSEDWCTSCPSILSILGMLGPHKSTSSSPTWGGIRGAGENISHCSCSEWVNKQLAFTTGLCHEWPTCQSMYQRLLFAKKLSRLNLVPIV